MGGRLVLMVPAPKQTSQLCAGDAFVLQDSDDHAAVSACPSMVASVPTCEDVPIAPGASMFVRGMPPCCSRKAVTAFARSLLSFWFKAALPTAEA